MLLVCNFDGDFMFSSGRKSVKGRLRLLKSNDVFARAITVY